MSSQTYPLFTTSMRSNEEISAIYGIERQREGSALGPAIGTRQHKTNFTNFSLADIRTRKQKGQHTKGFEMLSQKRQFGNLPKWLSSAAAKWSDAGWGEPTTREHSAHRQMA